MHIQVNGEMMIVKARFLEELLSELDIDNPWLAIAVNHQIISKNERAHYRIHDHDQIEILTPMQGG